MMSLALNLSRTPERHGGDRAARGRAMPPIGPRERRSEGISARRSGSRKPRSSRKTRLPGQGGQRRTSRTSRGSSRLVNPQRKEPNEEAGGEGGSRPPVAAPLQLHPSRLGSVGNVACLAHPGEERSPSGFRGLGSGCLAHPRRDPRRGASTIWALTRCTAAASGAAKAATTVQAANR